MSWLSLAAGLVSLAVTIVQWLDSRGKIEAALSQAILKGLRESDELIAKAQSARAAVRSELERNPDTLHDNDGFRRD